MLLALMLSLMPPSVLADGFTTGRAERLARAGLDDPDFFPIGVWLQQPRLAAEYAALGINLYVGLWQGPTVAQLDALAGAGMRVIPAQNPLALAPRYNRLIAGWLLPDEPDNAQPLPLGLGYGLPIPPEEIAIAARRMVAHDPEHRPVMLNLGQGVANDRWRGRGPKSGDLGDYPAYAAAADILSFDIYPLGRPNPDTAGRIDLIGKGVSRLGTWGTAGQRLWAFIGASQIEAGAAAPTQAQLRSSVWMALIHGARGIVYFVHRFAPGFNSAALLQNPALMAAVTEINADLGRHAAILNAPALPGLVEVEGKPVAPAFTLRAQDGAHYLFAIAMTADPAGVRFRLAPELGVNITDLDTGANIAIEGGGFDAFFPAGYAVRRFRISR